MSPETPNAPGIAGDAPDPGRTELPVMTDGFGRAVEYLRISVTDKCNLRCVYCMPMEGLPWLKREELLSYEEIERIVRVMAGMGLRRVRIRTCFPDGVSQSTSRSRVAFFMSSARSYSTSSALGR